MIDLNIHIKNSSFIVFVKMSVKGMSPDGEYNGIKE